MKKTLQELKDKMKEMLDKDGRFSDHYRKLVMDKMNHVVDEILQRGKKE